MTGHVPVSTVARLRREIRVEIGFMTRRALLNVIAGSTFVPRPLRWAIYRCCGIGVRTMNIFPGLQLSGVPTNLSVETGTFINVGCFIELVAPVQIGQDCQIGMQVMVITSHHESSEDNRVSRNPVGRPVVIGDRVWIGARATILPGVRIAADVVIAAGAVVAGDCASPGVYAGVPATLVRPADRKASR